MASTHRPVRPVLQADRRQFLLGAGAASLGLATLGLTGCGPSAAASKTFTFTFWGTGAEKTAVTAVVDSFAKSRGLGASAQSIPQNYETKLNTLLAANNPPDAGYLTQGMAMRLGTQNRIVNVVGEKGFDQVIPSALHYYAPGKAVTQTCVEAFGLWYNETLTKQAGVTPPQSVDAAWSWDQFVEAADKLTVDDQGRRPSESGFDVRNTKRYGTLAPSGLLALLALLKSNGVDLFDERGTKTNIDSAPALKVLQDVADLTFVHRVAPTAAQATQLGGSSALLLGAGQIAMAIDGAFLMPDMHAQKNLKYNVGVLPKYEASYTTTVSGANGVFSVSKHRDDALSFLLQLLDPGKVPLYSNGLWMPALEKYYTTDAGIASWTSGGVHPSGFRTAVIDPTLKSYVNYPAYKVKNFSAIEGAFNGSLPALFTKKIDLKPKVEALAKQVNGLMQGVYQDTAA